MKEFLLSTLPEGSILAFDVSGAGREARFSPSEPVFATWNDAAKFFLDLGANQDILNAAQSRIKQYGIAKLSFSEPGNASAAD